jgi:hypothetical protein
VHYLFLITALFRLKARRLVAALSWALWRAYVPSTCRSPARRWLGDAVTALLLLPGATVGALIRLSLFVTRTPLPPMLSTLMAPPRKTTVPHQPPS